MRSSYKDYRGKHYLLEEPGPCHLCGGLTLRGAYVEMNGQVGQQALAVLVPEHPRCGQTRD